MHDLQNFLCTMSNQEKNCLGVCDITMCMWSLFRNAIATLPSQNNSKLQANVIKFPYLLYSVYSILIECKLKKLTFV